VVALFDHERGRASILYPNGLTAFGRGLGYATECWSQTALIFVRGVVGLLTRLGRSSRELRAE
jgi:hypothetical protein